ncbi:uncharacterized protein BJ212DRAFT_1298943 [Suillus subaureus]|uniref:Uncharacterized protein n=1 Tax=Suillus subaureus TaxID=48587 RepID=A0A9P7EDC0_9AGAM|nr:uncharacterized protein BJ212DRAFT_1298943 [Suillus subaureus]KAG1818099.1 hypothetical protein BJ212DRAFT_1298943 [Suillus subaureus]
MSHICKIFSLSQDKESVFNLNPYGAHGTRWESWFIGFLTPSSNSLEAFPTALMGIHSIKMPTGPERNSIWEARLTPVHAVWVAVWVADALLVLSTNTCAGGNVAPLPMPMWYLVAPMTMPMPIVTLNFVLLQWH